MTVPDYTLPELVDADGLRYEVLDGAAEILAGVHVIPTPGHTAGHQSVIVRRRDGTVVIAGQQQRTTRPAATPPTPSAGGLGEMGTPGRTDRSRRLRY